MKPTVHVQHVDAATDIRYPLLGVPRMAGIARRCGQISMGCPPESKCCRDMDGDGPGANGRWDEGASDRQDLSLLMKI